MRLNNLVINQIFLSVQREQVDTSVAVDNDSNCIKRKAEVNMTSVPQLEELNLSSQPSGVEDENSAKKLRHENEANQVC
jgi:hypothetical protein